MPNGEDVARICIRPVDDSVRRKYEFADFLAAYLRDDTPRKREVCKLFRCVKNVAVPFEGGRDSIAKGDLPHDAVETFKFLAESSSRSWMLLDGASCYLLLQCKQQLARLPARF